MIINAAVQLLILLEMLFVFFSMFSRIWHRHGSYLARERTGVQIQARTGPEPLVRRLFFSEVEFSATSHLPGA